MFDPLALTFKYLASTQNVFAVEILLPALDVADERIRTAATAALTQRRSSRGHMELIRRLHQLTPEMRTEVAKHSVGLEHALRQALTHGDEELRGNALDLVQWLSEFGQLPALLTLLEQKDNPLRGKVLTVIGELVDHLHDYQYRDPDAQHTPPPLRDAQRIRDQAIGALDTSCNRLETHGCNEVMEWLLILADVDNFAMKKVLRQLGHPGRNVAEELLLTSTHPGIMSKVISFMSVNFPPQKAVQAIRERTDPEFISLLLRSWPRKLSQAQEHNYRQVESIAWLQSEKLRLDWVPPALHHRLIAFVQETGLPIASKRRVLDWMIKFGSPEARETAAELLGEDDDIVVQEIVIEGLHSDDPELQAWATSQLRVRGIPQTFELLIERLDSPLVEVQQAARKELGDFDLKRLLDLFDHLPATTCLHAGKLIQKIDPDSLNHLRREMSSPMRSKRIRAARLSLAMQVHDQLQDGLIRQLEDGDSVVRRTAVEVLANLPNADVLNALRRALDDDSARVREEAERSIARIAPQVEGGTPLSLARS